MTRKYHSCMIKRWTPTNLIPIYCKSIKDLADTVFQLQRRRRPRLLIISANNCTKDKIDTEIAYRVSLGDSELSSQGCEIDGDFVKTSYLNNHPYLVSRVMAYYEQTELTGDNGEWQLFEIPR